MKHIKSFVISISVLVIMLFLSTNTYADTKTITGVNLHVNQDISPGDDLDDINVGIGNINDKGINVYANSDNKYTITEVELVKNSNKQVKIGDELRIKVRISPAYTDGTEYNFKSSYSKSNVSVQGADFVSANKREGDLVVTLKLKPVKGTLEAPYNVYWMSDLGRAAWDAPKNGTGYYDIVLKRGSTEVTAIRAYHGTSVNLYPYMTVKGNYSFKVRSVAYTAEQKKYGTNSEYIASDDLEIAANEVSDGKGKLDNSSSGGGPGSSGGQRNANNDKVGWIKENNAWYYKYPDGNYKKNGWEYVNNKWYLFDNEGRMLTGWQKRNGSYYFLNHPDGDMKTGWIKDKDIWYYLATSGDNAGAVLMNSWITDNGKRYYLNKDGAMAVGWTNISNSWYYFYSDGSMAVNTTIDTFYVDGNGVWKR